jgi:chondroitin AC lyase
MKNHFRPDYSSYHVVDYDIETGEVLDKATCQGYADESSWSRGQAWGLYGYIVCFRETKDLKYLNFAIKIANYIMNHPSIPPDKIPYWDYHVNNKNYKVEWNYKPNAEYMYRDVSAATITASALLELSLYVDLGTAEKYERYAEDILFNIGTSDYIAEDIENNFFILKHSVGSIPHGGDVDKPLNYADYYYLEAISRMNNRNNGKNMLMSFSSN